MLLSTWQVGQLLWSMLWFSLFFLWIWTVVMVFGDIFRSHDLGGVAKAVWSLFVIFLPFLGVLAYLTVRGHKIAEHRMTDAERTDQAMQAYIRSSVTTPADDLGKLVDMHDRGVIDDAEFEAMRQRLVSS